MFVDGGAKETTGNVHNFLMASLTLGQTGLLDYNEDELAWMQVTESNLVEDLGILKHPLPSGFLPQIMLCCDIGRALVVDFSVFCFVSNPVSPLGK